MKIHQFFALLLFSSMFLYGQSESPIRISEVMFNTSTADNSEFVELYNSSETATINLSGYSIKYFTTAPDLILAQGDSLLNPGSFAVVFENDYDIQNGIYTGILPDSCLIFVLDDGAFGTSGMSNSTNRTILLLDEKTDTADTYTYSIGNGQYFSDEKILQTTDDLNENWTNSLNKFGTPGFKNSVTPLDFDLEVKNLRTNPPIPSVGDTVKITFDIKNLGLQTATLFTIVVYEDLNKDSLFSSNEEIKLYSNNVALPGDSAKIEFDYAILELKEFNFAVDIQFSLDENLSNNLSFYSFTPFPISAKPGDIVINEIMFAPSSGEPEWIEIFNQSDSEVNIYGWEIGDRTSSTTISTDLFETVQSQKYIILTSSNSISGFYDIPAETKIIEVGLPALNNTGDLVVLSNPNNKSTIDSLEYYPSWVSGAGGRSLERKLAGNISIDSANWGFSSDPVKATPGKINSISPKEYDLEITGLGILPEQPVEEGSVDFSAVIKNIGLSPAESIEINIYMDSNNDSIPQLSERILQENIDNLAADDSVIASVVIDNLIEKQYVIFVEVAAAQDDYEANNFSSFKFAVFPKPAQFNDIVINEIMYSPLDGEPEWIEIYNKSLNSYNLSGWQVRDASSSVLIPTQTDSIHPKEYLLLTADKIIGSLYQIPDSVFLLKLALPALNNSGDQVKIYEPSGKLIDSVKYDNSWGGNFAGRSLERFSFLSPSIDSSNWGSSISEKRATPGLQNSISQKDYDVSLTDIFPNSQTIYIGDSTGISVVVKNIGKKATTFLVTLWNDSSNSATKQLIESSAEKTLNSGDSIIVTFDFFSINITQKRFHSVEIFSDLDEGPTNNNIDLVIIPSFRFNDIVINEIMPAPTDGEPEWIEIFNNTSINTINLNGWRVQDRSTSIEIKQDVLLKDYLVLSAGSSVVDYYSNDFDTLIISLPSLNNSGDDLKLIDESGAVVDSVNYTSNWITKPQNSLERINVLISSNDDKNWGSSDSPQKATPGLINSLSQKDIDLAIQSYSIYPKFPLIGDTVSISCNVRNVGKLDQIFSLSLFDEANQILETIVGINITGGDSAIISFNYKIEGVVSDRKLIAKADLDLDQNQNNNILEIMIKPTYPQYSLVINEVMSTPLDGEPEWIEIFNRSIYEINMLDWKLSDVVISPSISIFKDSLVLLPNEYLVVAKDSLILDYYPNIPGNLYKFAFANLNNDADGVVLKDFYNRTIDSLFYDDNYNLTSGKSLERIDTEIESVNSSNWLSSIAVYNATPGRINSVSSKDYDLIAKQIISEPEFPVDGEAVKFSLLVENFGDKSADSYSVNFYYGENKNFFETVNGIALESKDSVFITTSSDISILGQLKIFAVINYEADQDTFNNFQSSILSTGFSRNDVQISEIMINPENDQKEWFEIFNSTANTINLNGWKITDFLPEIKFRTLSSNDIVIAPGEYLQILDIPSLGNTSDGIIILDSRGATIDSLFYNDNWEIKKGRSLERLSLGSASSDSSNWRNSISESGSTPGTANSISGVPHYEKSNLIINEIMFDAGVDNAEFIEFYNNSESEINLGGWRFTDGSGSYYLSENSLKIPAKNYFVLSNDSSFYNSYPNLMDNEFVQISNMSFSLSNSGESISVFNLYGEQIDSVNYSESWHNPNLFSTTGKSLERMSPFIISNDPDNWSSSADSKGATPWERNSILVEDVSSSAKVTISPNPFSPDSDGFEDFTLIKYNLSKPIAQIRVKVFDSRGRLVRTLINNSISGAQGSFIFDGFDENGKTLKIGIYILLIEAIDEYSGTVEVIKEPVVIAKRF